MSDRCDKFNIDEIQCGIRGRFDPDQLRGPIWSDQARQLLFDVRGEARLNAMGCSDLREVAVRAAVDIGDGDYVGTGS